MNRATMHTLIEVTETALEKARLVVADGVVSAGTIVLIWLKVLQAPHAFSEICRRHTSQVASVVTHFFESGPQKQGAGAGRLLAPKKSVIEPDLKSREGRS
jgi:hypothetical protein